MKARFWIALGALAAILAVGITGDVGAQSTERGYLAHINDYNQWTVSVSSNSFYAVWIRADDKWVDFDLYVYDANDTLICSSTGPGGLELCVFYAWHGVYYIKVVSVGGCPPSGAIEHRSCGEGWYTLGI
jgi:hypothetical protein